LECNRSFLQIRPDRDEQLQIGHARLRPRQVRPGADLALDGSAPILQIARCGLLPCPLLLRLILDANDRPHPHPQILDGAHQRLVQRGLERLHRVQSMLRANEAEDGIRLRKLPPLDGEHRQGAEGGARLARSPLIAAQRSSSKGRPATWSARRHSSPRLAAVSK